MREDMSQPLIDKILNTARKEAEAIEAEGAKRAKASEEVILKKGMQNADAVTALAKADAEQDIKTARLMCELDGRKAVLKTKREIISTVYSKAFDRLLALPVEDKKKLLYSIITKNAPESDITLTIPEGDADIYSAEFIKSLEDEISKRFSAPSCVSVSDTFAPFKGGVIMTGKKCDVNASFEQLTADAAELYENDVSVMIFKN